MEGPLTYDICMIAVPDDASVAEKLAASIRRYRLPRGTLSPESELDHRRICIDICKSPSDDATRSILDSSRCLAVLCSPATRNDPFILERLEYFRDRHRDNSIITVLVRGEPADSFPESFIEKKTVRRILPDMTVIERVETIEPVASDLRAETRSRWKEVLSYETVRITASVLDLHPDDLEQRHRMRRRKAAVTLVSVIAAVSVAAAGIFAYLGHIAKSEGEIAEQQAVLCVEIAERTMNELPEAFRDDPRALGYVDQAVEQAKGSLREAGLYDPAYDEQTVSGG